MIQEISHMTFIVNDLDRMELLLTSVLGAKKIYDSGESFYSRSEERFFLIGGLWIAIMKGDPLPERSYNHIAFKIEDGEYDIYCDRILSLGLNIEDGRPRAPGEGRSIYFYDFDNHLFELHTSTLEERLSQYEKGLVQ